MGKRLRKNKTKRNIPIRVAALLFCLTLVSLYLNTRLVASYTTTAKTSHQARVAKFSINSTVLKNGTELTEDVVADLIPGESMTVDLQVENNSEVAVEYTVAVANVTNNLPLRLKLEKTDSHETGAAFTVRQDPGRHSDKYTLTIEWPVGSTGTTEEAEAAREEELALMGMVDHITVTVTAVQTD